MGMAKHTIRFYTDKGRHESGNAADYGVQSEVSNTAK